jgi:NADH:ubiquinone oxidoreductase subunit 2 (subunit N)
VAGFLSTLIGAIASYGETDIKRFMAYSSTSVIGLLFMVASTSNIEVTVLYGTFYFFLCLIFFLSLVSIQTTKEHNTFINDFKEITKYSSISAYLKSLILCYLAGLPPTLIFTIKIGYMYDIFLKDVLYTIS